MPVKKFQQIGPGSFDLIFLTIGLIKKSLSIKTGLRDHDRVADLLVAHRSINRRPAKTSFYDRSMKSPLNL